MMSPSPPVENIRTPIQVFPNQVPRPSVPLAPRGSRTSPRGWRWGPHALHGASTGDFAHGLKHNELDLLDNLESEPEVMPSVIKCLLTHCQQKTIENARVIWSYFSILLVLKRSHFFFLTKSPTPSDRTWPARLPAAPAAAPARSPGAGAPPPAEDGRFEGTEFMAF